MRDDDRQWRGVTLRQVRSTRLRQAAIDTFDRRLTPKAAPLVRAMLLGDPSGLTTEDFDAYRFTGTVHLLVVSGFHVGLIASALFLFLRSGLTVEADGELLGIALVVVYVAIVGGQRVGSARRASWRSRCAGGVGRVGDRSA